MWNVSDGISKALFELLLADFARTVGAGPDKGIVLQLDKAGWHGSESLAVPDGIRLVYQPSYGSELQPAEHQWRAEPGGRNQNPRPIARPGGSPAL